ncbi:MAG: MgtC/SapB family protein [Chloroflexota bacterium]|nr:MgtC/SapB family protein [Chloroflexota bacterium]
MIPFQIILLRLCLALVLGALIGLERESSEHSAGLRTNALVALGSSLFTIISAVGFSEFLGMPHIQVDPTRIASYVIAGIGFLGGGIIFVSHEKEKVKGLTTAAAIWLIAAVGMACGAGLYWEAVLTTFLALIVLSVLPSVEHRLFLHKKPGVQHVRIEATSMAGQLIEQIYAICTNDGIKVETLHVQTEEMVKIVEISCYVPDPITLASVVGELSTLAEVRTVQADLHDISKESRNSNSKTRRAS